MDFFKIHEIAFLVGVEVGQRLVGGPILGLVVEHVVTVGKGSTLHVLTGQTDVHAFLHEGAEGQGLAHSPVNLTILHHFTTSLQIIVND